MKCRRHCSGCWVPFWCPGLLWEVKWSRRPTKNALLRPWNGKKSGFHAGRQDCSRFLCLIQPEKKNNLVCSAYMYIHMRHHLPSQFLLNQKEWMSAFASLFWSCVFINEKNCPFIEKQKSSCVEHSQCHHFRALPTDQDEFLIPPPWLNYPVIVQQCTVCHEALDRRKINSISRPRRPNPRTTMAAINERRGTERNSITASQVWALCTEEALYRRKQTSQKPSCEQKLILNSTQNLQLVWYQDWDG